MGDIAGRTPPPVNTGEVGNEAKEGESDHRNGLYSRTGIPLALESGLLPT